ncbi:hypothetical protein HPB50_023008 [Hyalomma asiaticum]|uniref:Uncharacterized protein n=1 Tax=Hyalomma asiaticum TaxID=266040 RepID=A0ACB7SS76_HYAAI|nr:hypothetical protein HPB50_023008 [Hyalomma asiaticum]
MEGCTYQMLSRLFLAVLVAVSTARLSQFGAYALYEDQAGKLDWRQRFIGKPLYVYADHGSVGSSQRIVVATEKNVLASLNTRNGALAWRQVLEHDGSMHTVSSSGELITVSGNAPFVRSWDVHTGVLQWEKTLPRSSTPLVRYDVNSHASELTTVEVHPGSHVVATVYNLRNGEMKTSPVVSAPWITDQTDAKIEQEFGDGNANVLAMFLTRITMQLCQLQSLLLGLLGSLSGTIGQPEAGVASRDLTRDKFGFNKVILLSTAAKKLFALDNRNSQIVWSQHFPQLQPLNSAGTKKLPIFVQRTTAHYPHPPRCTVLGKHSSGNGYLVSVNPITGAILDTQELPYHILQSSTLPFLDDEYTRGLLFLDSKLGVHTYPSSAAKLVYEHRDTQYLFTADPVTGDLVGYSLRPSNPTKLAVETVWAASLQSEGQKITHVVMRNPLEHVHSQGRVMGDRSVLYKYLNPNLVAVVTEGTDNIHKVTSVTVHLIDVITGAFIYSGSHKRARGPVHVVHSENWIVYCYHNEKSRRAEISVIELYEGAVQSNTSAFSSFNSPPGAIVEHQSYVFPSSIDAMVDTVTEKGITSKHVLLALPTGAILELPKALLDPRRPITPTALHREEGLVPYMPELPINAEHIVNYNQSVARVAGFATAASGLESTCLVVTYGLDIFYTRVAPSKTFDILKDDFDHVLISVVLTILILVSYVSKRFSARKALRAAWK